MSEVVVLLAAGRHPVSGRPRRAPADARALELGLRLAGEHGVSAVHAGDPDDPALREYLGMGLPEMTVLRCPPASDVLPPLAAWLAERRPRLLLAGDRAEHGLGSGMLPYRLAALLGAPLVPRAVMLEGDADGFGITVAESGGHRRRLAAPAPLMVTLDRAAPAPRPYAFARARRGRLSVFEPAVAAVPETGFEARPARRRPRRLQPQRAGSAAERLAALRGGSGGGARAALRPMTPETAARQLLEQLERWGVINAR